MPDKIPMIPLIKIVHGERFILAHIDPHQGPIYYPESSGDHIFEGFYYQKHLHH